MLTNFLPNRRQRHVPSARVSPTTRTATRRCSARQTITCTNAHGDDAVRRDRHAGAGRDASAARVYATSAGCSRAGPAAPIRPMAARARRDRRRVRSGIADAAGPRGPTSDGAVPGGRYPGITNALGVVRRSTRPTLANGVHTIAWIVTADNGTGDRHRQPVLHRLQRHWILARRRGIDEARA